MSATNDEQKQVDEEPEVDFMRFLSGDLHVIESDDPITSAMIPEDTVNLAINGTHEDYLDEDVRQSSIDGEILKEGVFPKTLKTLEISNYALKAPLSKGVLPCGLKQLEWNCNTAMLPGSLPEGLVHLRLGGTFNQPLTKGVLPKSLRVLDVVNYGYNKRLAPGVLPEGLKQLMLPELYMHPLEPGVIPSSLEVLVMDCKYYDFPFKKGIFPADSKLTNFVMRINVRHFNQPFGVGSLPAGLINLDLTGTETFDQPFRKGVLPRGLKVLKLGHPWSQPLTASMFDSCQDLEVLSMYEVGEWNHPIKAGVLPPKLRGFHLPGSFKRKLKASVLPSTLEFLSISDPSLIEGKLPAGCKLPGDDKDEADGGEDDEDVEDDE